LDMALPSDGCALRILDLDPIQRAAGPIFRTDALADDALITEPASVREDMSRIAFDMLVEHDRAFRGAEQLRQLALAILDRFAPCGRSLKAEPLGATEKTRVRFSPHAPFCTQEISPGKLIWW